MTDNAHLTLQRYGHFDRLLAACKGLPPLKIAVVAPEEENALNGALLGADENLITPILIGDADKIAKAAQALGRDLSAFEVIDIKSHDQAAAKAVAMIHEGHANALMKGHLHTEELLRHVVKREGGLRTKRRLSHVYAFDIAGLDRMLLVSDAAINIAPDLTAKVDITQNAIDVALAVGLTEPKVAILSAVETVNPQIPSTIDAATISKMAERGQIKGGIVDGPLAMDNAMNLEAAKTKGIASPVAGRAEVLIVPNLEAGNMVAKELIFVAHADCAGIVVGAKVPIILTSRADDAKARLISSAMAVLCEAAK